MTHSAARFPAIFDVLEAENTIEYTVLCQADPRETEQRCGSHVEAFFPPPQRQRAVHGGAIASSAISGIARRLDAVELMFLH